jgi:arginine/lysine/ornithine decarboxylase
MGSSRATGGHAHGRAFGNHPNLADFGKYFGFMYIKLILIFC